MTGPAAEEPTRVGIALVRRGSLYLIRRRPEGSAMAGYWEFPGGKCEPGEAPASATARECLEEIGVAVAVGPLIRRIVHRYPHGLVELFYYDGSTADPASEPEAATGFVWVEAGDLPGYRFPDANEPLIAELARAATE